MTHLKNGDFSTGTPSWWWYSSWRANRVWDSARVSWKKILAELVGTEPHAWWPKKTLQRAKVSVPKLLLLPIPQVWSIWWPGTGKKISTHKMHCLIKAGFWIQSVQSVLLEGEILKRTVVLSVQETGSTHKRLSWSKTMSLDLLCKMIWNGSQPTGKEHVYYIESYTIPYAMIMMLKWHTSPAQKEATYCSRVNIESVRWTGSILNSSTSDLVYQHRFPQRSLVIFKISTHTEVVTYPCRNATIVCGASQHMLGSCICFEIPRSCTTVSQILHQR